jgi:hypothetical protein
MDKNNIKIRNYRCSDFDNYVQLHMERIWDIQVFSRKMIYLSQSMAAASSAMPLFFWRPPLNAPFWNA